MYSDKMIRFMGYYTKEQVDLDNTVWLTQIEHYYERRELFDLPTYDKFDEKYEQSPYVHDPDRKFLIINDFLPSKETKQKKLIDLSFFHIYPNIKEVIIEYFEVEGETEPIFNYDSLSKLKNVEKLSLIGVYVDNLDFLSKLKNLKTLTLSLIDTKLDTFSLRGISTLPKLKEIEPLYDIEIFNEFSENSHKFPNIEKINLTIDPKDINEEGVTIDKLLKFKNLKIIKMIDPYNMLEGNQVNLSKLKKLEEIDFISLELSDLKKFKNLKKIKSLFLYDTDYSDEELKENTKNIKIGEVSNYKDFFGNKKK